ncbi:MAG: hypothetical protein GY720_22680 [bacterium]|nr:hypothetical protein [bacterium]
MTEQMNIAEVIDRCRRYWSSTHVPSMAIKEMQAELASHLEEARSAGKTPEAVIGPDLNEFAEEWARTYRQPMVAGDEAQGRSRMGPNKQMLLSVIAIAVITAATLIFTPKENDVDNEIMQWAFLGGALLLFVGEILTAGFFLLPFAIGASIAAVLAFLGVPPVITLLAFLVISVLALIGLQRYTDTDDDLAPVGANRYDNMTGTVLVPVSRLKGTGRVRVESENWRAGTDRPEEIAEGVEVKIIEVRGTRLIVAPVDEV